MKIITNGEHYIQKGDLEFLLYNDGNFPMRIFDSVMGSGNPDTYVKITSEEGKKYIEEVNIPSFNSLYNKSNSELELAIKRLRKIMDDEMKKQDSSKENLKAEALISRFKSQRRRAYLLSQYQEMLSYRKGVSKVVYPDIPNPCVAPVCDGSLVGTLSLQRNKLIFYDLKGNEIESELFDLIYELTLEQYETALLFPRIDDEVEIVKRYSEDGKYLSFAVETKHCESKKKPFMRLFQRK